MESSLAYEVRTALAALIDGLSTLPMLDPASSEYEDALELALRRARRLGVTVERVLSLASASAYSP
jgi:hypothetical protein